MVDPFNDALVSLVERCPGIEGAAFTDLDGEDIAHHGDRENLRLCAAYGGIALRRLTVAEQRAGRGPVQHVILRGTAGGLVALKVGDEYQLVLSLREGTLSGRVVYEAAETVETLEQNI